MGSLRKIGRMKQAQRKRLDENSANPAAPILKQLEEDDPPKWTWDISKWLKEGAAATRDILKQFDENAAKWTEDVLKQLEEDEVATRDMLKQFDEHAAKWTRDILNSLKEDEAQI